MKIGLMCHSSFGGSVRIATDMAVELARRGHRIHRFTPWTPFYSWDDKDRLTLHPILPDLGKKFHPSFLYTKWSNNEFQTFLSHIMDTIISEGLDILHFHYAVPFAFIAGKIKDVLKEKAPCMAGTLHGTDVIIFEQDPVMGSLLMENLKLMDALTSVSESHARLSKKVFRLSHKPVVIPNFVDLSKFRPPDRIDRNRWGLHENGHYPGESEKAKLVHVSNFRPVKDLESVAMIFIGIRKRVDAELWMIGENPEMKSLASIFKNADCSHDVHFIGLKNDVIPIIAKADLMLISSFYESFCLAALESMACGVPVLATDVGGVPEVVRHGKTGLLYKSGDHASAIEYGVKILTDKPRHMSMKKAAVRHARKFEKDFVVSKYEEFYKRLLKSSSLHEESGHVDNEQHLSCSA